MAEMNNSVSKIPQHIFRNYIVEKLRVVNPHLAYATDESAQVLGGAVVHIPNAGASPSVVKNRKSFPASAALRDDSMVIYPLDVYSTDPTHVPWHEQNETSYNKLDSVLGDHVATLADTVGDNMFYNWVTGYNGQMGAVNIPSTHIISTTGASTPVKEAGQTGNRKSFTYADLQNAQALMNKQNVPLTDRYACLESYQLQQLITSLSGNQMAAFQQSADLANGVIGMLCGFKILERSRVLVFTSAGVPKLPGEAFAASDNVGALCWQKNSVAKALGETKLFRNADDPLYYGDVISALVKMGGRCRRADWAGMVAIVQASAS